MASNDELFANALSLPARDRAKLAHELIESLDDATDSDAAELWLSEIRRRAAEVREGRVALEDWDSVYRRLQMRWGRR